MKLNYTMTLQQVQELQTQRISASQMVRISATVIPPLSSMRTKLGNVGPLELRHALVVNTISHHYAATAAAFGSDCFLGASTMRAAPMTTKRADPIKNSDRSLAISRPRMDITT